MTKETILKKAIERAVKNGFDIGMFTEDEINNTKEIIKRASKWFSFDEANQRILLFSHDFAKALGYKLKDLGEWCDNGNEPLDYIKKFIDK